MRQCKCGGVLRVGVLTGGRESWRCSSCKRYEITERTDMDINELTDFDAMVLEKLITHPEGVTFLDFTPDQGVTEESLRASIEKLSGFLEMGEEDVTKH